MTKSEFFRLFKLLTQQIDMKGEENNIRKSLFDNFIENYYMTGVIMMDGENVNFDKFRKVYENYQMNIYDIVDLIFGRV